MQTHIKHALFLRFPTHRTQCGQPYFTFRGFRKASHTTCYCGDGGPVWLDGLCGERLMILLKSGWRPVSPSTHTHGEQETSRLIKRIIRNVYIYTHTLYTLWYWFSITADKIKNSRTLLQSAVVRVRVYSNASVGWHGAGCSCGGCRGNSLFPRECSQDWGVSVGILGRMRRRGEINRGRKIETKPAVWNGCCRYWFRSHFKNPQRTFSHTHALPATQMMPSKSLVCVRNSVIEDELKCRKGMRETVLALKWFGNGKRSFERTSSECNLSATGSLFFSHHDRPEADFRLLTESLVNFAAYLGREMPAWIGNDHLNNIWNSQLLKFFWGSKF